MYILPKENIKYYFENLFSFKDIGNTLIYLKIDISGCIVSDLFQKINNFKLLKYLYIKELNFTKDLCLKLNELSMLSIKESNIINVLKNSMYPKLKELYYYDSYYKIKIDEIENANFKVLKFLILDAGYSNISNIKELEKGNFSNLEILKLTKSDSLLDLSNTHIIIINVLKKFKFNNLEKLNIIYNKI